MKAKLLGQGLTAPKVTMGGGEGLTKDQSSKRTWHLTVIDYLHCLHSHLQHSDSFVASGICPGSLASCFTQNGPSFVKSCLISFCYFVQSSLVAKQTIITFGATNGGSITFNILSGQIDFSWTQINLWISREHFPTPFIFSSLKTFALHRKKTSDMEIFFSVSPALISNECQF